MKNFFNNLMAKIRKWIYGPACTYTFPCCDDPAPDEKKEKKSGGIAY